MFDLCCRLKNVNIVFVVYGDNVLKYNEMKNYELVRCCICFFVYYEI